MADFGKGRADHEPALGLGRREARCAASRRAAVDLRPAGWAQGPLRPVPALFLGYLELLGEQARREEPAYFSVTAPASRAAGRRWSRLRPACLRQAARFQDPGR